jgi:hypothetical protein
MLVSRRANSCLWILRGGDANNRSTGNRIGAVTGRYSIIFWVTGHSLGAHDARTGHTLDLALKFMASTCKAMGCKGGVPPAIESEGLCVLHFTLEIERACAEMRRETVLGTAPRDRQLEIIQFIAERGELLARVTTSGVHLTDELKARALNTFLTLINLRENLDRAALRAPVGRTSGH